MEKIEYIKNYTKKLVKFTVFLKNFKLILKIWKNSWNIEETEEI